MHQTIAGQREAIRAKELQIQQKKEELNKIEREYEEKLNELDGQYKQE